jgi:hypothetical protein
MPGDDGYVIYLIQDWVKGNILFIIIISFKGRKEGNCNNKNKMQEACVPIANGKGE